MSFDLTNRNALGNEYINEVKMQRKGAGDEAEHRRQQTTN